MGSNHEARSFGNDNQRAVPRRPVRPEWSRQRPRVPPQVSEGNTKANEVVHNINKVVYNKVGSSSNY